MDISLQHYNPHDIVREKMKTNVEVDVIIPVHNASKTIVDTIQSAMNQVLHDDDHQFDNDYNIEVHVCCYDDGSTDDSWSLLNQCQLEYDNERRKQMDHHNTAHTFDDDNQPVDSIDTKNDIDADNIISRDKNELKRLPSFLWIQKSSDGVSRGAGYARNQAVYMRKSINNMKEHFLCFLDSDDRMYPTRIVEQLHYFWTLKKDTNNNAENTIVGSYFVRDPPDATWHYTQWANHLANNDDDDVMKSFNNYPTINQQQQQQHPEQQQRHPEQLQQSEQPQPQQKLKPQRRLYLECFREITIIQPTWMIHRSRFIQLGGYIEAPTSTNMKVEDSASDCDPCHTDCNTTNTNEIEQQALIANFINEQQQHRIQTNTNHMISHDDNNNEFMKPFLLIHPTYDTIQTLRIAEDLRFFYSHLYMNNGSIRIVPKPLIVYKHHSENTNQSSQTSRQLLVRLRTHAFASLVLNNTNHNSQFYHSIWHQKHIINNHIDIDQCHKNQMKSVTADGSFIVWGAGRDGKDFIKALYSGTSGSSSNDQDDKNSARNICERIYCIVDVDSKKIKPGYYVNKELRLKIPIIHFSFIKRNNPIAIYDGVSISTLISDLDNTKEAFGRIDKKHRNANETSIMSGNNNKKTKISVEDVSASSSGNHTMKRLKEATGDTMSSSEPLSSNVDLTKPENNPGLKHLNVSILSQLPVVVCVAMYRTNGALEHNVRSIGRTEGIDLWHFN